MDPAFLEAARQVFLDPWLWVIVLASAAYGVFMGAVPGLTATMAMALMVPLTYWLDPVPALAAIVTMEACAIFAGDIPSALLRMPGTPASASYTEEAYGLTKRGKADLAMGLALVSSVFGGLFGALILMALGPSLARVAAWFSTVEYFWLYLLGLSCAVVIARESLAKGLFAMLLGLMISTVGLSAVHAQARFTFGVPELYQGIDFIPAMIGLFGLSEVFRNLLALDVSGELKVEPVKITEPRKGWLRTTVVEPALLMAKRPRAAVRSGLIGTAIGILPGAGADIASWVTLAVTRRLQKDRAGDESAAVERLCDAGNANNSALAGAWIPALVFGIPGDSVTAIVLGVLLMKNIKPGPEIFTKQASLVYALYLVFILANVALFFVGLVAIKLSGLVVRVPRRVLLPVILLSCVVGSYSLNGSAFDVWVMLVMGVLGFVLERRRVPLGPVVLGIILGGPLEERFLQTLTGSGGSVLGFFDRPLSGVLGVVCVGLWVVILVRGMWRGRGASDL